MAFFFTKTIRYLIVFILLYTVVQYGLRWKSYSVSPKAFRSASAGATGSNGLSNVNKLRNDLRRLYTSQIVETPWEAVYGGGLSLRLNILYASPTEFIVVFHAPHQTTGFAGWHWINSTCTVLNGEVRRSAYSTHGGNKETYGQGKNFRHGEFERYSYEFTPDTYLACYGRGAVPVSVAWFAPGSLANGDPVAFVKVIYTYTNACLQEMARLLIKTFNYYKAKALKTEL